MTALGDWNQLSKSEALTPVLACCGSHAFASAVVYARPYAAVEDLIAKANDVWWSLSESDWLEAFACHPRIGESHAGGPHQFAAWSAQEQSTARSAGAAVLDSIADKNREYETRHGFIYIVCASGRPADELLAILERRIGNSTEVEMREAAEQQRQITNLRIRKWLTQ